MQIKRRGLRATVLATAVFAAVGSGTAWADSTSGNIGIANGNQVTAPIAAAVDVCGNAVAVIGVSTSACDGGASAASSVTDSNNTSSLNIGIANGNQITAPIAAAVDVCGNAIAVIGKAVAACSGGASANADVTGGDDPASTTSLVQGLTNLLPALPAGVAGLPALLPALVPAVPAALPALPKLPATSALPSALGGLPLVGGSAIALPLGLPLAVPAL